MKTRIKNIEECTKLFHVEIPHDLVKETAEEVYQEIKKVAKIPGFRPGSAPFDLLEKHYSKDVQEEIIKRLIPKGYTKALENHKIVPVGLPRVFNIKYENGKPLTFEAEVNTKPNIKLKSYKNIKVRRKRISVSEEEINDTISRLRGAYTKYNDVQHPIKKGDYAVCDVEAFVEGKPITKKNNNMWILADKEASLLGMGEELVGLMKGQAKEIEAKLPDNYPDEKYRAKLAKFKVVVNEVKEKELPALDDTFAKKLNAENLETLKKEIESQLFTRKESALKIDMKNQILDMLLKTHKFSVPTNIVERQKEVFAEHLEAELLRKGLSKDDVDKKIKELDSKLKEDAKDKVRLYFILDEVALKENIDVSNKDIEEKIKSIAASYGQSQEEVRKYYEKEKLLGGLAEEIKEEKVLESLLKEADILEEK